MLWSDLDYSATYVLSESDHPFGIRLYRIGDDTSWISVRLKNYSKTDVQWMLSELPLKLRETRNAQGRDNEILVVGDWVVTYWPDHAGREIRVVRLERVEG